MRARNIRNLNRDDAYRGSLNTEYIHRHDIIAFHTGTAVPDIASDFETSEAAWFFVRADNAVVGAIHIDTLRSALQYKTIPILVDALIEHIPTTIAEHEISCRIDNQTLTDPVYVVEDEAGQLIGYYCADEPRKDRTSYMLPKADQALLMSDLIIGQVATSAAALDLDVYIIGGWVRDFLMNTPSYDLDFAVAGDAIELATHLALEHGGVVHRFSTFGGAHWVISDTLTIDFTETRKETYRSLASLPVVERTDIYQDLKRRDFTMNAIAIAVHKAQLGLVLDPFGGLPDLHTGQIRSLHGLSFLQDPTRIFRAARYSTRFKMDISNSTRAQIEHAADLIQPGEMLTHTRIGIELSKIFKEEQPHLCWERLIHWTIWTHWQPAWSRISLHDQTSLEYPFTDNDWHDCWWMQLRCSLSDSEANAWSSMISIRPNGLKLWGQFPMEVLTMIERLTEISNTAPQWKLKVGHVLQKSVPTHWLFLEATTATFIPFIQWWIDVGRQRTRQMTGRDILAMGVPKGPQIATLLTIAQHTAWEGGDKEDEQTAIRAALASRSSSTK